MRSTEFAKLHIPIASVKQGDSHFAFRVQSFPDVKEGASFPDPIIVEADVQPIGDDFLADIVVESEGSFICDRCGKTFCRKIKGKVQTFFRYEKGFDTEGDAEEDEDVRLLQPSDRVLDISRDVIDSLLLSIPFKNVCRENCKGLCPNCGTDLNVEPCTCTPRNDDSPWDALKKIHLD